MAERYVEVVASSLDENGSYSTLVVSQLLSEAQHYLSILESVRRHGWEYLEKRGEENDTTSTLDESKDTTDSSDMQKSAEANDTAHTDRRRAFIGSIIRDLATIAMVLP